MKLFLSPHFLNASGNSQAYKCDILFSYLFLFILYLQCSQKSRYFYILSYYVLAITILTLVAKNYSVFSMKQVSGLNIFGRFHLYNFTNCFTVSFYKIFNKQFTWMISEFNLDSKCAALSASLFSSSFFIFTVAA